MDLIEKIIEAKDIIGDDAACKIAEFLHLEKFDENKLRASCPFHGSDSTPSFIWNKKDRAFKCFGCGKRYSILDMYVTTEGSYKKAVQRLFKEANLSYSSSVFDKNINSEDKKDYFKNYIYPKDDTEKVSGIAKEYLNKRGISDKTIEYVDLRQDTYNNIAFQLRDTDNVLLATKYRPSRRIKHGENKMFWQPKASTCPSLYNMNRVDITQPLVVTEGYFDCLAVLEAGYTNVVSINGGAEDLHWIEFNYEYLENFEQIILWFDNDKAGQLGVTSAANRLGEYRCKVVKPTSQHEEYVCQYYKELNDKVEIKKTDANNILLSCGSQEIISLINNAEEFPVKNMKYLMDCESVSVADMEKCSTTLKALDNLLYGNLYPCFTIYSGVPGAGKSSLANVSTIISALEANEKVFVFSGELEEGQLLDWIMAPLAGVNHIIERKTEEYDRSFYFPTTQCQALIKKHYHDNIILFDNKQALDSSSTTLIDAMNVAYKKYGCRTFLVDNLMSISFDGNSEDDKWDTQKKFIIQLMNFTNRYNVSMNLVVHPRKLPQGATTSNSVYDLHGASEIGNLCHRLLWVSSVRDGTYDENVLGKMKINVVKDRPSQSAGRSCELWYDKRTRRIFTGEEELYKQYSWEKEAFIEYPTMVKENLLKYKPKLDLSETSPY